MQEDDDHHRRCAPVVNAAQKPPQWHVVHDVIDRLIRLIRRRIVIHRQKHAADEHRDEHEHRRAAECERPARSRRELLEQERPKPFVPADALRDGAAKSGDRLSHTSTRS